MRARTTRFLCLGVLAAVAVGQGNKAADELRDNGTASAAYVQDDFIGRFRKGLADALGEARAAAMFRTLGKQKPELADVLRFVNGDLRNKDLTDWLGARRSELERVKAALAAAVQEKNKRGFFGGMVEVMLADLGVDPSAEYFRQVVGAVDAISADSMQALLRGARGGNVIEEAFGFRNNDDQKFMRTILRTMESAPFVHHPMLASMGMSRAGRYHRRLFREKLTKNMAGYGRFGDGTAGGMPFDRELPPFPYFGADMEKNFKPRVPGAVR